MWRFCCGAFALSLFACDQPGAAPAVADSSAPPPAPPAVSVAPAPPPSASAKPAPPPRKMPPRPVPTSAPTVTINMPDQVQLQAIQYMSAMQAPQPDDPPAEPSYVLELTKQLAGAADHVEMAMGGRRIDLTMKKGCEAQLPKHLVAQRTGAALSTLLTHGVLVLRCADSKLQCLQSTRDPDDVLCTRK